MKQTLIAGTVAFGLLATVGCSKKETSPEKITQQEVQKRATAIGPPTSYGFFSIINVASSKILEVNGDANLMKPQPATKNVQQYTNFNFGMGTSQNQKWQLIQQGTGTITGSTAFKIRNVANGMYLEAPNSTAGTQLWTNGAHGFPSQIWYLHRVGTTNNYYIQNANGLVLTNAGSSTANGAPITQAALVSNNTQYWNFDNIAAEGYRDDEVVRFLQRTSGSISFDQVNSIPLTWSTNNGKTLWIGEDTYTSNNGGWNPTTRDFPCYGGNMIQFFDVRNSALIQPSGNNWNPASTTNMTTTNSTYMYEIMASPNPADHGGTYTWPGVGVEIGQKVWLYAHEGGGSYNQSVLYELTQSTGTAWGNAVRHTVSGMSTQNDIGYPLGFVKPGDGYVYPFGNLSDAFGGKYLYVARFATGSPTTWSFWNGTSWVSTPATANTAQLGLDGNTTKGLKTSASVTYINGKYVLVEMDFGYGCPGAGDHNIYISTATSPTGPFNQRKKVYAIQDKINGVLANHYVINAHPQFNNGRNELLVTYCLNYTGCQGVSPCTNNRTDPYYYQAKAVRIPYTIAGL